MARPGRPTKFTAPVKRKILKALRDGNYREVACRLAGVSYRVMCRWMKRKESEYRQFRLAVLEAESAAESTQVRRILSAAKDDPKQAQWWLERKFPERWCSKSRIEIREMKTQIESLKELILAGKS